MKASMARRLPLLATCCLAISAGACFLVTASNAAQLTSPIVIELFTSQGCSSCPPADALLGQYVGRDDVIPLSLPVDYWDRLGWKDTFAKPAYSERQRAYARAQTDGGVYTPQVVIDGRLHVIGSSREQIEEAIEQVKNERPLCSSRLDAGLAPGLLTISISAGEAPLTQNCGTPAVLYLAEVQRAGFVKIARGENAGRDMTYHNVVTSLSAVLNWDGRAVAEKIPITGHLKSPDSFYVLILQARGTGRILAAQIVDSSHNID